MSRRSCGDAVSMFVNSVNVLELTRLSCHVAQTRGLVPQPSVLHYLTT